MRIFAAALAVLFFVSSTQAATKPLNLCVKGTKIQAKTKCAKGETLLSLSQLIGPQGPAGAKGDKGDKGDAGLQGSQGQKGSDGAFSVAGCEFKMSQFSGSGVGISQLDCDSDQFLLNYGIFTDTSLMLIVDSKLVTDSNDIPQSISYVVTSNGTAYNATIEAFCCPR